MTATLAPHPAPDPLRGAAAGLLGGLVASLAMDLFQAAVARLSPPDDDQDKSAPATEQAADRVALAATGAPVPGPARSAAGQAVHYGFGALLGAGYGLLAEYWPAATTARGGAFGMVGALLFDEAAVPLAGLGAAPWKSPPSTHAYALASHIVFGTSTEAMRRLVRDQG